MVCVDNIVFAICSLWYTEPTSALDPESSASVEKLLASELRASDSTLKAIVWITHSEEQGQRVGTRHLYLADGCCREILQSTI